MSILKTNAITTVAGKPILNSSGSVLQVVSTTKTDQFATTSTTAVDVTGLNATITPSSSTSKILVIACINMSESGNGGDGYVRLLRGSTTIGNGNQGYFGQVAGQDYFAVDTKAISFLDSPSTTAATTYKVQVWGANTTYVNGRGFNGDFVTSSCITLLEIA